MALSSACASQGCQGCTPQPIPGGFPEHLKFDNAMQVRLTPSGFDFVEKNFAQLVTTLVPGGLSFTVPPTDCASTTQKICCTTDPCTAEMSISSVDLTPTPQSTLKMNLRAQIKTTKIKFERNLLPAPLPPSWLSCDVVFDSTMSAPPTLGFNADINFVVGSDKKLKIARGTTELQDFSCGDVTISGGLSCTVVSWLCTLFRGLIEDQLMNTVDSTIDGMLKDLPMGQEGRIDLATFLKQYSPRTTGIVDYFTWAGGYAQAESNGMSLGATGGFRAGEQNPCVPNCEKPGATCTGPAKPVIARSAAFRGNTRPDGKSFDVGIGVDSRTLDVAAYSMYSAGGMCLDVTTQTVPQLSSDLFAILVPSLRGLTNGQTVPMMVSVRPRTPPTVELGKGTYHQGSDGKVVIDDPLLKIKAKDFAVDIYVQLDERMVRLFTIVGDVNVPVLLYADAEGRLQPMVGSLDTALTNIRVENAELITEDTETLAKLFPTILGVAGGFLASGLAPIELPSVQGLKLVLDGGSITTTDNMTVLAIFASLGLVKPTSLTLPDERVDTEALKETLRVPPTSAFRLGPGFEPFAGPELELRVRARIPAAWAGHPLEFAYRIDGGWYHPWVTGSRLIIQDPVLWLQGEHWVEVMARVKDQPATTDPTPARLRVVIDTIAPEVTLVPVEGGVRAEVHEVGTPSGVELSWSIAGGPFTSYGKERTITVPPGAAVAVRARDQAGNQATAALGSVQAATAAAAPAAPAGAPADGVESGGCSVGRIDGGAASALALLLGVVVVLFGRRRRR